MSAETRTEPIVSKRCKSSEIEHEGRTHNCRKAREHDGSDHECICQRTWGELVPS